MRPNATGTWSSSQRAAESTYPLSSREKVSAAALPLDGAAVEEPVVDVLFEVDVLVEVDVLGAVGLVVGSAAAPGRVAHGETTDPATVPVAAAAVRATAAANCAGRVARDLG
ncbi:MAG: hypothetical protein E6Q56_03635 [Mycobacterium sp.]|nr:MAG: hypothetical protein E6Q56_03635 [Mycobacterium sp.]HQE13795.1 hypothetical protein [Mycobacterium sp.]